MNANVGTTDRVIRLAAGIVIIALGIYKQSWWGALGLIPLLTAVFSYCPLYCPLNISTRKH